MDIDRGRTSAKVRMRCVRSVARATCRRADVPSVRVGGRREARRAWASVRMRAREAPSEGMDGGSPPRVLRTRGRTGQRGGRRVCGAIHSRAPTEADVCSRRGVGRGSLDAARSMGECFHLRTGSY